MSQSKVVNLKIKARAYILIIVGIFFVVLLIMDIMVHKVDNY